MVGLILEGGGMRCAFTAGVLDQWMADDLYFHRIYGVSAGAGEACSYVCHQPGRGLRVWLNYLNDPRFCSLRSLLTTGDLFGAELSYDLVPRKLDPLDDAAYQQSGARLIAVATDVTTGRPLYLPVIHMLEDVEIIRASASLPLVSNIVDINGVGCLDGGIADSIPIRRAIADGCDKNVLVLTQAPGYRKEPNKAMGLIRARYHKYPRLVEAVERRHLMYNDTLDFIAREEQAGRLFVLRPDVKPEVGRVEKDPHKLQHLHDIGAAIARREHNRLLDFLQGESI